MIVVLSDECGKGSVETHFCIARWEFLSSLALALSFFFSGDLKKDWHLHRRWRGSLFEGNSFALVIPIAILYIFTGELAGVGLRFCLRLSLLMNPEAPSVHNSSTK